MSAFADRLRAALITPSGRRLHLTKMLTWRFVATGTTMVIAYIVTGDLLVGATIGGAEAVSKMALYYWHERAWARLTPAHPAAPDRELVAQASAPSP